MKENTLLVEKYRPRILNDFIGNNEIINLFSSYIRSKDIPHLLLFGRSGTGKTTAAKLLVSEIGCDFLYINASDENDVETIRTKVKRFALLSSESKIKIVILDEADYLSLSSQAALRNLMEATSSNTRFILTANYNNRIIEPLVSRCVSLEIRPLSKSAAMARLDKILKTESVSYSPEDLVPIINSHFPDLRKIINALQRCIIDNKLIVDKNLIIESDYRLKIIEILTSGLQIKLKFEQIRKLVLNNQIKEFNDIYRMLYENIDKIVNNPGEGILIISEQQYRDALVIDKEITFMACIIRLLGVN